MNKFLIAFCPGNKNFMYNNNLVFFDTSMTFHPHIFPRRRFLMFDGMLLNFERKTLGICAIICSNNKQIFSVIEISNHCPASTSRRTDELVKILPK